MIPVLYFLLFFVLAAALTYGLTVRGMNGAWSREGPATVAAKLRRRNRLLIGAAVVIVLISAAIESLLVDYSDAVLGIQYAVGDAIRAYPALVYETAGGTVSVGLYVAIVLGLALGALAGTAASARAYPVLRGLGVWHI